MWAFAANTAALVASVLFFEVLSDKRRRLVVDWSIMLCVAVACLSSSRSSAATAWMVVNALRIGADIAAARGRRRDRINGGGVADSCTLCGSYVDLLSAATMAVAHCAHANKGDIDAMWFIARRNATDAVANNATRHRLRAAIQVGGVFAQCAAAAWFLWTHCAHVSAVLYVVAYLPLQCDHLSTSSFIAREKVH